MSHHLHCNDTDMDEDVFSSFPLMRFDARLPKYWFHNFQHLYMWAAFPMMQVRARTWPRGLGLGLGLRAGRVGLGLG